MPSKVDTSECNPEVYECGKVALVIDACMFRAEEWVQKVTQESGQRVDWHYSGGRAVVLYLGDQKKVLAAAEKLAWDLRAPMEKTAGTRCRCQGTQHDRCDILSVG